MATITQRKRKKGTVYRVEICVRGRRESATFDTKSAAHAWAEETEHLLRAGQPLPGELPDGDRHFDEAVTLFLRHLEDSPSLKPATKRMYNECASRLLPVFGGRTLKTIARRDMAAYRDRRLDKVGSATIRQDFVFVRRLYKHALLQWDLETPCPVDDVPLPAPPRNREPILSQAQIEKLLDWCCVSASPRLYSFVLLLLHTAMRPSEAATLRWEQARLPERVLLLTHTKTGVPRRVPLTATAIAALENLRKETGGGELVFFPADYQLPPVASNYFRSAFATACKQAGLEGITLYSLRHIAASYLIMGGVDIRTVADIMGHSQISMTMRYTHLLDRHKLEAIQALDKFGR